MNRRYNCRRSALKKETLLENFIKAYFMLRDPVLCVCWIWPDTIFYAGHYLRMA